MVETKTMVEEPRPWSFSRMMAQYGIPGMTKLGISGAEALRRLRDIGVGYREQDFYRDWNYYKGQEERTWLLGTLGPKDFVPRGWMTEPTVERMKMSTRYHYVFEITLRDPETLTEWTENAIVASDTELMNELYMGGGRQLGQERAQSEEVEFVGVRHIITRHQAGTPFG